MGFDILTKAVKHIVGPFAYTQPHGQVVGMDDHEELSIGLLGPIRPIECSPKVVVVRPCITRPTLLDGGHNAAKLGLGLQVGVKACDARSDILEQGPQRLA